MKMVQRDGTLLGSGAERAARFAGWAGAVSLLSSAGASGAVVVDDAGGFFPVAADFWEQNVSAGTVGLQMFSNPMGGTLGSGAALQFVDFGGGAFGVYQYGSSSWQLAVGTNVTSGGLQALLNFASTAAIAGNTNWLDFGSAAGINSTGSTWLAGQQGYIGFRIVGTGEFGWVSVTIGGGFGSITLNGWSPNTVGGGRSQSSSASSTATPEPATTGLALLALGAAAASRHRRKRKSEQAA